MGLWLGLGLSLKEYSVIFHHKPYLPVSHWLHFHRIHLKFLNVPRMEFSQFSVESKKKHMHVDAFQLLHLINTLEYICPFDFCKHRK